MPNHFKWRFVYEFVSFKKLHARPHSATDIGFAMVCKAKFAGAALAATNPVEDTRLVCLAEPTLGSIQNQLGGYIVRTFFDSKFSKLFEFNWCQSTGDDLSVVLGERF